MGKSYAVLGLGKFGKSVALNLMKDGAEVLAVDQKEELVRDIVECWTCCSGWWSPSPCLSTPPPPAAAKCAFTLWRPSSWARRLISGC